MPTASNALLKYEAGQNLVSMVALTDSGDSTIFNSVDSLWSNRSGYTPDVKPDGLAIGGKVIPAISGTNNMVDGAELNCYLAGVYTNVAVDTDLEITRGVGEEMTKHSVTITSAGAYAILNGTEGAAFSDVRAAAGGPPLIPVGDIEIAQIHCSTKAAAAVEATEIKSVIGTHVERFDFPTWEENRIVVSEGIMGVAGIAFASALPLSHTAAVPKKVYAEYYTPELAEVPRSVDFVRPAESHSVSSTQVYGGAIGATSKSLGQGSFTAHLSDGVSDNILKLEGENLWFKFQPDRLLTPYVMCQGILGLVETYPADNAITAKFTISAEVAGERIVS